MRGAVVYGPGVLSATMEHQRRVNLQSTQGVTTGNTKFDTRSAPSTITAVKN
jgi:hypothetical protein